MDSPRDHGGQTLVELALVLPVTALLIFTGFQIVAACVNLVILETKAAQAAHKIVEVKSRPSLLFLVGTSLWGRTSLVRPQSNSMAPQPWRPFKGVLFAPTLSAPGCYSNVTLQSTLLPGLGFTQNLNTFHMKINAETYVEPDPPAES
jgi:hypothetical protein